MQAAWYETNGAAADVLKVGERPDPEPAAHEVRVRLHVSAVNPSDVKARGGSRKVIPPYVIPGSDGAGVIDAVGPYVDPGRVGERVWIYNAQWGRPFGASAQHVCLPEALAVRLPAPLDFAHGACLGIPCMTAHRCLFADGPVVGLNVLVTGGAGVVGHYAIQLAKWAGARVIATVSSPEKAAHARAAGADAVVDYRRGDVVREVRAAVGGIDRVVEVDLGVNLPDTSELLRPNGVIAAYATTGKPVPELPYATMLWKNPLVRQVFVYTMPDAAKQQAIADIARWVVESAPVFAIAARLPLAQAVDAHRAVESGTKIGQVLLDLP
jgi:NADPH2:quinone reductase